MENTLEVKIDRMFKLEGDGKVKAFFDITLNNTVLIRGLKIVGGKDGEFIAMPGTKGKDNKWYDGVRCLSEGFKQDLMDLALEKYRGMN